MARRIDYASPEPVGKKTDWFLVIGLAVLAASTVAVLGFLAVYEYMDWSEV